ncbi:uncharacterized protein LOC132180113 [Corylus avellana]|uniref:uncharacterized protein LOC132180113 n=1 Tax=Corylus avellana TaxID=13451 RepID=UPI001E1FC469|nr:uncharacterized protein LOC132180113 [Corylus avellana]
MARANMLMLRQAVQVERGFSKHAGVDHHAQKKPRNPSGRGEKMSESPPCWVPHPRSGVYFPKGHEHVIDDLPAHAASLNQTFWLRNVDGVDKADPDSPPYH